MKIYHVYSNDIKDLEFIEKEEVTRYNNIIFMLTSESKKDIMDILEVVASSSGIKCSFKSVKDNEILLIAGSTEVYKNIFRNIKNSNNLAALKLLKELPKYTWLEHMEDFIENSLLEYRDFRIFKDEYEVTNKLDTRFITSKFTVIDPIKYIMDTLDALTDNLFKESYLFKYEDLIDICDIRCITQTKDEKILVPISGTYRDFLKMIKDEKVPEEFILVFDSYSKDISFGGKDINYLCYISDMYMLDNIDYDMDKYISSISDMTEDDTLFTEVIDYD